jgi:hypothetical protein
MEFFGGNSTLGDAFCSHKGWETDSSYQLVFLEVILVNGNEQEYS